MRPLPTLRHQQKGNALVAVSFAVVALITLSLVLAQAVQTYKYEQTASVAIKRVEVIHDAMQKAYMDAITTGVAPSSINAYPQNAAALIASGYVEDCQPADEIAGRCLNMTKLPWVTPGNADQTMTIARFADPADGYPAFRISFSVAGLAPIKLRNIVRSKLTQLPNFSDDGAGNISFTFRRPGTAVNFENLVSRDGSTPMTDNWDFGNHYLENVKDISFAGLNDRTAITGTVKIGSTFISNSGGQTVSKPTCPSGYAPRIEVWTIGMGGNDTGLLGYNTRSFAAWFTDIGASWRLYFRSLAENSAGSPMFFYQGSVAYATWCEFS